MPRRLHADQLAPSATAPWTHTEPWSRVTQNVNFTGLFSPTNDTVALGHLHGQRDNTAAEQVNILNGPVTNGFQGSLLQTAAPAIPSRRSTSPTNTAATVNGLDVLSTFTVNNPSPAVGLTYGGRPTGPTERFLQRHEAAARV